MILLPATKPDPTQSKMSKIDEKMSTILNDMNLSKYEKMRRYYDTLRTYIELEKTFDKDIGIGMMNFAPDFQMKSEPNEITQSSDNMERYEQKPATDFIFSNHSDSLSSPVVMQSNLNKTYPDAQENLNKTPLDSKSFSEIVQSTPTQQVNNQTTTNIKPKEPAQSTKSKSSQLQINKITKPYGQQSQFLKQAHELANKNFQFTDSQGRYNTRSIHRRQSPQ
jgi:hypothetical protein